MDTTLYKLNKRGKLQMWRIYTTGNQFSTEDWIENGKVKMGKPTTCKPKNVGRSNATTGDEQAELEARAKVTKKLNQGGYVEDRDDASMYARYWQPMLADVRDPEFPCWVQPKLDGGRCCYRDGDGKTREGKDYYTIAHITEEVKKVFPDAYMVDGELYNHELHDDFNKIMSLIKKQKPTEGELAEAKQAVQYWVYDILDSEDDKSTATERIEKLREVDEDSLVSIFIVPSVWVTNQQELDDAHADNLENGFEGSMIRLPKGKYKRAGRSADLLKFKNFDDDEFEILDIEEGKGNREGEAGAVVCTTTGGLVFGAGIKGDEKLRKELLVNKNDYISKMGTITFFGYTKKVDGVPRFPVYKGINERE